MNVRRILAVIERHFYEARRSIDHWVNIFFWPILDMIVWGLVTLYLSEKVGPGFNLKAFLLGAVILWGVFYSFMRDIAMGFLDELWSRNLLNIFSTPVSIWEYICGLLAINFLKIIVGASFSALLAFTFYKFNLFAFAFALIPYFFNLLLFATALGFFVTGLIFRYTTKIQALSWSFAGLLGPISAVFYPLSTLPPFLQRVAWFLPTMHSFEGMRQALAGGGFSPIHFWWGFGLDVFYLAAATVFFKWMFEVARRLGLLTKME